MVTVFGDQHPDAFVESMRWQICEAQLMQALGRGRGINRTAKTPLDIDILADTVLPIDVDEVIDWHVPNLLVETAFRFIERHHASTKIVPGESLIGQTRSAMDVSSIAGLRATEG